VAASYGKPRIYFHDYPEDYLYRQPPYEMPNLYRSASRDWRSALILIVSDAGAARYLNAERVEYTQEWIEALQKSVRYLLGSILSPRILAWHTASEIAQFVPMFEMSREGMNAAIRILRGRPIAGEAITHG
jgi:hypothetical protein